MKTLGYLGLGVMGYGMTGNLIDKSGCDLYGYDPGLPPGAARSWTTLKRCTKPATSSSCACPPTPS